MRRGFKGLRYLEKGNPKMRTRVLFALLMVMVMVTITSAQPAIPAAQDGVTRVEAHPSEFQLPAFGPQLPPAERFLAPECWASGEWPGYPANENTIAVLAPAGSGCQWTLVDLRNGAVHQMEAVHPLHRFNQKGG